MASEVERIVERFCHDEVTVELVAYYLYKPDLRGSVESIAQCLGRSPEEVERALGPLVEIGIVRVREVPGSGMKLVEFVPLKRGDGVIVEALQMVRKKYEALFQKVLSRCFDYALANFQRMLGGGREGQGS